MAMTYTSLTAAKGTQGSIANWVSYSKLDLPTIVDEAQSLLYGLLRVREMTTDYRFMMPQGTCSIPLPARFLDPIGRIRLISINSHASHKDSGTVQGARNYDETTGALATNPFTTTNGSTSVTVALASHGLNQGAVINIVGATAFNGITLNGTFPVSAIVDTNTFTVDISILGVTPNASSAGGGSAVTYTVDNLVAGIPTYWAIWGEHIHFDTALSSPTMAVIQYYQSLPLLSGSNVNNFLTDRYPQLMRFACLASAADFMKDTDAYTREKSYLEELVQATSVENDGYLRGIELDTLTP
jgi:hypothetical protein